MKKIIVVVIALLMLFISLPAMAQDDGLGQLTYGRDKWIQLHFLMQAQMLTAKTWLSGESESDAIWSKSAFLRRSRIILKGQVTKNVTFFMETDDFNIGKSDNSNGTSVSTTVDDTTITDVNTGADVDVTHNHDASSSIKKSNSVFTQDAYINYKVADELQFAFGLILLPFMHENRQSAVSLLGVDYNSGMVFLGNTNVWRDTGLEARGLILNGLFDYKIGVFQGTSLQDATPDAEANDNQNRKDFPRVTGRVQVNFMEPETGFFYSGNYLGKKKIVSFGMGMDWQKNVAKGGGNTSYNRNYWAATADFTLDYGLGGGSAIALHIGYLMGQNNPALTGTKIGTTETSAYFQDSNGNDEYIKYTAYFIETGFLIGKLDLQPVIKYMASKTDDIGNASTNGYDGEEKSWFILGCNYLMNGHNANIKVQFTQPLGNDNKNSSGEQSFIVQGQIFL